MKRVVAIDGPSGSGKTTIAKLIAEELGFHYLDTGALYRAIALAFRDSMVEPDDPDDALQEVLGRTMVTFSEGRVFLNGNDVSDSIRSKEIDHYSSVFSGRKIVRDFLFHIQRDAALRHNLVVEGRDTTTVIFPDAQKKIFLDASVEERAERRYLQYKEKNSDLSMEEAKMHIIERDRRDESRDLAPLQRAGDALLVDSSGISVEQVKDTILGFVREGHKS